MRTLFCLTLSLGLFSALTFAEGNERSVYLRPSSDAPKIGTLPEGAFVMSPAEPVELSDQQVAEGWEAISFLDDLNGFVARADLSKDLFVNPGARVYSERQADPRYLITRAEESDSFDIESLGGDWVEVSFRKPITAFVRSDDPESGAPVVGTGIAATEDVEPAAQEEKQVPQARSTGEPISSKAAIPTDDILRTFEGWLGQPRSFFGIEPVHPFQVVDASGNRIAYLDLSRLLITTPLEHFIGRKFHFYGRAEPIEGRRDFVIRVEQMQQR